MASLSSLLLCQNVTHHPRSMWGSKQSSVSSGQFVSRISFGKPDKFVALERLNHDPRNNRMNNVVTMCAAANISPSELNELKRANKIRIFSGTANQPLSREIASSLHLDLGRICIKSLDNQETYVRVMEGNLSGCDVYIVQSTCAPVNDNLMELLFMINACRSALAETITVVIPYFGYARVGNWENQNKESNTAKLVANQIEQAGADRIVVMDIHSVHFIGPLNIPVIHLQAQPVMLDYIAEKEFSSKDDVVVVSPDIEGINRARAFSKELCTQPLPRFAFIHENSIDGNEDGFDHNATKAMQLAGDVQGKVAILYDDMIDTGGTVMEGALLLRRKGAKKVYVCATHAVFSPPGIKRLSNGLSNGLIDEVIVTNTIPVSMENYQPGLTILSIARLLRQIIWKLHTSGGS